MITKEKILWSFIKFSQLILKGNVWRSVWRICMLILGLKGLRFEQWLIVGGFWTGVFTTITTTITIIYFITLLSNSTSARSKIWTCIKSTIIIVIISSIYIYKIFNNYSLSPNGLWVNEAEGRMGYWPRGHEGGRNNNCFSKIQLVGKKYRE